MLVVGLQEPGASETSTSAPEQLAQEHRANAPIVGCGLPAASSEIHEGVLAPPNVAPQEPTNLPIRGVGPAAQ